MSRYAKRPVHLNLFQIKLPIAGVMSIMHRLSGVFLVLSIPLFLWWLDFASRGQTQFAQVANFMHSWQGLALSFLVLWALSHHFLAGIRYLLLDVDVGVERPSFRYTAWAVVFGGPILALGLTGVLL